MSDTTSTGSGDQQFSADTPIQTRDEDLLGRRRFAERMAEAIRRRTGKESFVIALNGPWGGGKTSIKNMVIDALRQGPDRCPHVVEFEPWLWNSQEGLTAAFFQEVGGTLQRGDKTSDAKERAAKWKQYSSYFTAGSGALKAIGLVVTAAGGGPLVGVPINIIADRVKEAGEAAKHGAEVLTAQAEASAQSLTELRTQLRKDLAELDRTILVVLDDVDRLSADEVALLFQLIKANANFPNLVYLVLFQRDNVERALAKVAPNSGREFLEKIVQVSFDVPAVEGGRLLEILDGELKAALGAGVYRLFDERRWHGIVARGVGSYFRTLRDVRRFINSLSFQVDLFYDGDNFEANPVDLILLEVLRVFEPDVYRELPSLKDVLLTEHSTFSDDDPDDKEERERVNALVGRTAVERQAGLREVLQELFPAAVWVLVENNSISNPRAMRNALRTLRVCHRDNFDRYFQLAVPQRDLSQAELSQVLASGNKLEELGAHLRGWLERDLLEVGLNRLAVAMERQEQNHVPQLITALLDVDCDLVGVSSPELTWFKLEEAVAEATEQFLRREGSATEHSRVLKQVIRDTSGLYLPVHLLYRHDQSRRPRMDLLSDADLKEAQQLCVEKVRAAARDGSLQAHPKRMLLLVRWRDWGAPEESSHWVQSRMESDDGLLSLLTGFVSVISRDSPDDGRLSVPHPQFQLDTLERFVPADAFRDRVGSLTSKSLSEDQQKALSVFQEALEARRSRPWQRGRGATGPGGGPRRAREGESNERYW